MKRIFFISLVLLFTTSFQGCFLCKDGNGIVSTETRKIPEFKSVEVSVDAIVTIRYSKDVSLKLEADENLLGYIRTRVRGKKLIIESRHCLRSKNEIKVDITVPAIEGIELNGTGSVQIPDTLHVKNMTMKINGTGDINARLTAASLSSTVNGSGDVILTGSANKLDIRINGSGDTDASEMPCNASTIRVNGSGDVNVYVIQDLKIHINGSGNVYYRGKPALNTNINGTGKVTDQN
ncbi:MAG: DUF2807 domain-containing protein [Bacteroidia bacterium]|nr:DUF2807 domain-containing protein [Bacteroidia bacterium]MCZ2276539.1 DUF2807 domain-containing protein [Bacteroidia bacterium]